MDKSFNTSKNNVMDRCHIQSYLHIEEFSFFGALDHTASVSSGSVMLCEWVSS